MPPTPSVSTDLFTKRIKSPLQTLNVKAITTDEKADRLRAYHAVGSVVAELVPGRASYGDDHLSKLAEAIGYKAAALTKLRAFAKCYNQRDLDQLCKLADQVSWSHVQLLLSESDKSKRSALQNSIVKNGWSKEQLRRALKAESTDRHAGGRPLSRPTDLEVGLRQIDEESERWIRLCREIWVDGDNSLIATLDSLPAGRRTNQLRKQALTSIQKLRVLKKECGILQRKLEDLA